MNKDLELHLNVIRQELNNRKNKLPKSVVATCESSLQQISKIFDEQVPPKKKGNITDRVRKTTTIQLAKNQKNEKNVEANQFWDWLEPLSDHLISQKIYVGINMSIFFAKAKDFLLQVPVGEWQKDTAVRFLSELLSILTNIRANYEHPTFNTLRTTIEQAIIKIQKELHDRGVDTIPENLDSNKFDWESVNFVYGCSAKPKGQLITLKKFSLKNNDKILQPGEAVVSSGYSSQVYDFLKNVEYVLLKNRLKFNSESWNINLKNIIEWSEEIALNKDAESLDNYKYLRNALNMLVLMETAENKKYIDKGAQLLKKFGVESIVASINDDYSLSKFSKNHFDVKIINQAENIGKVIRVMSFGFIDSEKSIISKAQIQVAASSVEN